jgi:MYXO-CTERM domain-containing protein
VPQALADAINNVFDNGRGGRGGLVIFAAGNDSHEIRDYELLAVRGVLGIGAINNYDEKTSFTNWGTSVDVVAPVGTVTTDISGAEGAEAGDYFTGFGGTSSACPVAAGVAALLASAAPEQSAAELYAALVGTARPAPYAASPGSHDPYFGWGIIDPAKALRRVLGLPEPGDERPEEGCGCTTTPNPVAWLALLAALGRRRRRSA